MGGTSGRKALPGKMRGPIVTIEEDGWDNLNMKASSGEYLWEFCYDGFKRVTGFKPEKGEFDNGKRTRVRISIERV